LDETLSAGVATVRLLVGSVILKEQRFLTSRDPSFVARPRHRTPRQSRRSDTDGFRLV